MKRNFGINKYYKGKNMVKMISSILSEDAKSIIDTMADGIAVIGMDGKLIEINPALEKIIGIEKNELIGKSAINLIPKFIDPKDRERMEKVHRKTLNGKADIYEYFTMISKDGREISFASSTSLIKNPEGKTIAIVASLKDITDLRRAEDVIRENENKYRTLVENLPQKIFLKDKNSVYISCNENCAKDLGIKPEEINGKTDYDLFPKNMAVKFREDDQRVMESGNIEEKEEKYTRSGREVWFQTVMTSVKDENGNAIGILGIFWDITERKQMEKELNEYHAKLEELVKERTIELEKTNNILNAVNKMFQESIKCENDEDVIRIGLDLAKELTDSKFGFIGELNPSGRLDQFMLGDSTMVKYRTAEPRALVALENIEISGALDKFLKEEKPIMFNLLDSHPELIKLPKGHLKLKNFLAVPLKTAGKTIGLIVLANKEFGYDLNDQNTVESLSLAFVEALTRKRMEQEISKHHQHLEEMVDEHVNTLKMSYKQLQEEIITHKEMEEALKESEQRFRTLLDNVSDGILLADPENKKFQFGNKTICKMLGLALNEIENLGIMDIHLKKDLPHVLNQFEKQARGEITLAKNIPVLRKDGTIFFADINSSQIILGGKKYIMGVFRDITERKEMEEKLHKLNEELEQRIKDKTLELKKAQEELIRKEKLDIVGKVIGEISHRLQTPLINIKDLVNQLKMKVGDSDEIIRNDLNYLFDGVMKADEVLKNLVNLSQIRVPILRESNINNIINEALAGSEIPENIIVETQLDENLPDIKLDADQIQLAFKNLISNAVQAIRGNGKIEIKSSQRENFIEINFKDTGEGILEKNMNKVFDPLFSTKAKKIGLGLPIAKNIIDKHNGKIYVISKVGKGTTFSIKLPLS